MGQKRQQNRKLRPKPNYVSAILSVALVLFLLGIFTIISTHSNELADYFKERINVIVELKDNTSKVSADKIMDGLAEYPQVREGSVSFISREEATELLKEDFGEDFLLLDMPNPLFDVITFNVKGEFLNKEELSLLRQEITKKFSAVADVYYQESMVDTILDNVEKFSFFILVLSILFVIVAIALIHNSIKLALYANRMLIRNMELIGASWGFIRKPFLIRAIFHGLISGLIAVLLLGGLLVFMVKRQEAILDILNQELLLLTFGGVILAGIFLTVSSTWIVISRYLRMRLDELF